MKLRDKVQSLRTLFALLVFSLHGFVQRIYVKLQPLDTHEYQHAQEFHQIWHI